MENRTTDAPTGCYKCGRPGHWSRDCPFSAPDPKSNTDSLSNSNPNPKFSRPYSKTGSFPPRPPEKASEKPKKLPRTRPKLTPEVLLSDDGLGYVLRHFPRAFKFGGRGHEVRDLGNLIGLYAQWHKHLIPYYSFEQFIHKVEQVGATRRVRTCIRELRDRVANGGDPSKLHEPPVEHDVSNCEPALEEATNLESTNHQMGEPQTNNHNVDIMQEEMFDEIYRTATEEPCQSSETQKVISQASPDQSSGKELSNRVADTSNEIQVTEEQRARMEANRLKALERAAARVRSLEAA
ncbi:TIMELESS-interacting protein [Telopea speciosissima]|uniref:TIMELESS-interacting protein n=1 Tax=Telopea speciosissima TaxID=54955 RepID=UPI001CC57E70|nr:TIMELESS-interacting protein [Telopea speciosissima]